MCEAYLKHHEDKQNCVHASAGKNEARNNVCVRARARVCERERGGERGTERERESEISKQKVLCWNPIVCIHMVPELELTLGICVRDIIIL